MKTFLLGTASFLLMVQAGHTADIYGGQSLKDNVAIHAAQSWTGLWAGAMLGAEFSNNKLDATHTKTHAYSETPWSETTRGQIDGLGEAGAFGELQLGYDRQIGSNVVVGVFGGLNINGGEFSASTGYSNPEYDAEAEVTFSQKWGGVLGPRLAYAHGNSLFYVAGGWAFGEMERVKLSVHEGNESASASLTSQETDLNGWFGEIGIEHKFDNALSLKVAGRYTDYGSLDLYKENGGTEYCPTTTNVELDRDNLSAMVGLVYRP